MDPTFKAALNRMRIVKINDDKEAQRSISSAML